MAFIGNTNITQGFIPAIDYFSGNGSTVAFTLSRPVASVAQVQANISNVPQNPSSAFSVSGNTITFTSAPPSGTNNIYVYYTSPITQVIAPSQGTVGTTQLQNGLVVNFADGSAASPSITNDGDTNTGIFFPAADTIAFSEAGVESMRIDSSGNLGIGVTPSAWGGGYKAIQVGQSAFMSRTAGSDNYIFSNSYFDGSVFRYINTAAAAYYQQDAGAHKWYNAASGTAGNTVSFTQAMTLDASGNLLVGTTSTLGGAKQTIYAANLSLNNGLSIQNGTAHPSGAGSFIVFYNSAGAAAGFINQTGTTTVAYTTSSDYRLKEDVQPMTGALAKVAALKPVTYKWKADQSASEGFIAHELAEVCPQAVVGEKDAVDADGNPKYQGIDTSFLVATLTAAIKEHQAIITSLTDRITALEGAK